MQTRHTDGWNTAWTHTHTHAHAHTHTHTHSLRLPLAAEISDGQKNEAFSPELSWAYKGSSEHPGRLHWRPKINTVLYTSSISSSTSLRIYPLLLSILQLSAQARRLLAFMFFFLYLVTTFIHQTIIRLTQLHKAVWSPSINPSLSEPAELQGATLQNQTIQRWRSDKSLKFCHKLKRHCDHKVNFIKQALIINEKNKTCITERCV